MGIHSLELEITFSMFFFVMVLMQLQIEKRLEPAAAPEGNESNTAYAKTGCTIFLGYTSNLISSGVRESIRYLAQHKMVKELPKSIYLGFRMGICLCYNICFLPHVRWMLL